MGWPRAAALLEYLAVFESGDDVFDAGSEAPVGLVVAVVDDPAGLVALGTGDGGDGAVAAVTEDRWGAVEQVRDGVAGHDDIVAVTRPAQAPDGEAPGRRWIDWC